MTYHSDGCHGKCALARDVCAAGAGHVAEAQQRRQRL